MAERYNVPVDKLEKLVSRIFEKNGLTAEDAAAFLCENLSPERIALSVVRPAG